MQIDLVADVIGLLLSSYAKPYARAPIIEICSDSVSLLFESRFENLFRNVFQRLNRDSLPDETISLSRALHKREVLCARNSPNLPRSYLLITQGLAKALASVFTRSLFNDRHSLASVSGACLDCLALCMPSKEHSVCLRPLSHATISFMASLLEPVVASLTHPAMNPCDLHNGLALLKDIDAFYCQARISKEYSYLQGTPGDVAFVRAVSKVSKALCIARSNYITECVTLAQLSVLKDRWSDFYR